MKNSVSFQILKITEQHSSLFINKQTVRKKYSEMRSRSIKVEKNKEIRKLPSSQFGYYSLFCKMGFPLNMYWKDASLNAHNDIL